ncbi:hypothetical protein LMG29542_08680 [Paraburkholderia humisilvae]|uniref:Uncharacterized protein n=4 Tax=Paraburkholderia humisilvae TaxID=627669 RepID=A0A6J5F8T2_9BURK|nr:hypothetical protein LMG29542_08680 [Paraburkholderia humisilvae]
MDECHEVSRRYVDGVAMSMGDHLTAHAAEVAAWVLTRPRGAGDLDWPEGAMDAEWPELAAHTIATGQRSTSAPVFCLCGLAQTRVRAWVAMTLAAYGPAPLARQREETNRALAEEHFAQAQAFDIEQFRSDLSVALAFEVGRNWVNHTPAHRVFDRMVAKEERYKWYSVDDFYLEAADFIQDAPSLVVEPCAKCRRLGISKSTVEPIEAALPPFHLSCSCKVHWQNEFKYGETPPT